MTTNTHGRARRTLFAAIVAGGILAGGALPAAASPTCSDLEFLGTEVHGHHVVRDYVTGGAVTEWQPKGGSVGATIAGSGAETAGGPAAGGHFDADIAPGASFCNSQSKAPGFHVPE